MGGFHLFQRNSRDARDNYLAILHEDDTPLHPLQSSHFFSKHEDRTDIDFTSFKVPTEEEIRDRGKSDWLAKSLVLLQMSWFVMQCTARAIEHLPVTHLKIVALAYAAMTSATQHQVTSGETRRSRAWEFTWEAIGKGLERIVIFIAGGQDGDVDLSREDRVPSFWANGSDEEIPADMIVLGVGVCFGAIHCISWGFSFPTHTELLIWRASCVAITVVPIYIFFGLLLGIWLAKMGFGDAVLYFCPLSGGILYIIARAITLTLAFTSLRDLPPGAYETVHWTTFIPHV